MRTRGTFSLLPIIITILTLADGLLHLRLDYVLFGGKLWGAPSFGGPPPGAAPPAAGAPVRTGPPPGIKTPQPIPFVSLPLNELFLLNFLGYVVLAFVFWLMLRLLPARLWIVDVVLILYTLTSIIGWMRIGGPNPQGLGYIAKGLEVALIVALGTHLWSLVAPRRTNLQMA